jgi:Flp pilus assembly pilin Flp
VLILSFLVIAALGAVRFVPGSLDGFFSTIGSDI